MAEPSDSPSLDFIREIVADDNAYVQATLRRLRPDGAAAHPDARAPARHQEPERVPDDVSRAAATGRAVTRESRA